MKQLDYLYSDPEHLKKFMQKNGLNGPILVQLFSSDKFVARRISQEIQTINKNATVSVLILKTFDASKLHFTVLPSDSEVVAQVQPLEFDFFHSRPVVVLKYKPSEETWTIVDATKSVSQWGYSPKHFTENKDALQSFIYQDDIQRVYEKLHSSISKGENTLNQQYRICRLDGSTAWISDYTQIIRDSSGKVIELIGYYVDITQDKEYETLYAEIINTTTEGFWLLDENLKIIDVNFSLCRMLGFKKDKIIGREPYDFIDVQDHPLYKQQIGTINENTSRTFEINLRTKKEKLICVLANETTIRDQLGKVKTFAFITDISNQKEIEEDLRKRKEDIEELNNTLESKISQEVEKNREKDQMMFQQSRFASMGEMIGNIAHQWRQPLNIIALVMQDLYISDQLGNLTSQKVEESYDKANNLLQYMSQTIDDFRYFFKQDTEDQEFSVKEALDSVYSLVSANFSYHHIEYNIDVQHDSIVKGGLNEFKQVLINILNNAQEAILSNNSQKKEIHVLISQKNNMALISIKDDGGGMSKDVLTKIFDPYFTTKNHAQGTGLGLYMSKQIIENSMQGSLNAKNIKNGAEFIIMLPIKEQ